MVSLSPFSRNGKSQPGVPIRLSVHTRSNWLLYFASSTESLPEQHEIVVFAVRQHDEFDPQVELEIVPQPFQPHGNRDDLVEIQAMLTAATIKVLDGIIVRWFTSTPLYCRTIIFANRHTSLQLYSYSFVWLAVAMASCFFAHRWGNFNKRCS